MKLHSMKLVTIVCEALARSAVTELLKEIGPLLLRPHLKP